MLSWNPILTKDSCGSGGSSYRRTRNGKPPPFPFLYVRNSAHGSEFAPVKKLHTFSALGDREFRLLFPTLGLAAGMKDYLLESRLYPRVLFLI